MLTYLLLAICVGVFGFSFWLGSDHARTRFRRLRHFSTVQTLAAILGAYLTLRPGRGVDGSMAVIESEKTGKPVMLDIYSNF